MDFLIQRLTNKELDLAKESVTLFLDEDEVVTNNQNLFDLLGKESFYLIVALRNGKVIGRLTAYEFEMYKDNTREAYLYEIDVIDEYKMKGVGTALIKFTKKICIERGVSYMFVGTEADNLPAQKLYLKTGADFEGNLPHYTYEF